MLVLGAAGGALYALIPAICKVRFGASEILDQPDAGLCRRPLPRLSRARPWRDPAGFNFPTTAEFDPVATVPVLIEGGRLHLGALIALVVVAAGAVLLGKTIKGFEIRVVGAAPRAARFGGFNSNQLDPSDLRDLGRARRAGRHHRGRRARSAICSRASRRATALPRSSSPSSGG